MNLIAGNASVLLQCASGIHGEHSARYIRHVQMNKLNEVAKLIADTNPSMVEDVINSTTDYVIAFTIEPKHDSIYKKDLLGVKQLEYVKLAQNNWIEYGTNKELCVKPFLRHNVSNTITVDDWDEVTTYIYENRHSLCGISLLAATGDKAYPQAPFTEVLTQEEIMQTYGEVSLFASGLIERGLKAFNNNLWTACQTALGNGENLTDAHKDAEKQEFVKSFKKFATNFLNKSLTQEDYEYYNDLVEIINILQLLEQQNEEKLESLQTYTTMFIDELGYDTTQSILVEKLDEYASGIKNALKDVQSELLDKNIALINSSVHKAKLDSYVACANCLKDVYNLHKWWKVKKDFKPIDWINQLNKKEFTDINTLGAQACSGGACEVEF